MILDILCGSYVIYTMILRPLGFSPIVQYENIYTLEAEREGDSENFSGQKCKDCLILLEVIFDILMVMYLVSFIYNFYYQDDTFLIIDETFLMIDE